MYNEEENIDMFFSRLLSVLNKQTKDYEVICANDGCYVLQKTHIEQEVARSKASVPQSDIKLKCPFLLDASKLFFLLDELHSKKHT